MKNNRVKIEDPRGAVLAEGEVTGHYHVATGGAALYKGAEEYNGTDMVLVVDEDTKVSHQEHDTQVIPKEIKGDHYVWGVVEIDPFKEEVRRVAD